MSHYRAHGDRALAIRAAVRRALSTDASDMVRAESSFSSFPKIGGVVSGAFASGVSGPLVTRSSLHRGVLRMPNAAGAVIAPWTCVAVSPRSAWIRARGGVRSASRAAWTSSRDPMSASAPGGSRDSPAGPERRAFELHPLSQRDALLAQGKDVRVVHMVRHAQGTHNVDQNGVTLRDPANHDARLTPFGEQQCDALSLSLRRDGRVAGATLVVTSPLTRCVQTALLCFKGRVADDARFVAHESVRETVNFACDARRGADALANEFGASGVDFSLLTDAPNADSSETRSSYPADPLWRKYESVVGNARAWDDHRESCDLVSVADRARAFFAWLKIQNEREVAVSSHSAFLRCLFSWGHAGGVRTAPNQTLCRVGGAFDVGDASTPVVTYGGDAVFEARMREDWDNCELRTFLVCY